jgi:hypothetical protein
MHWKATATLFSLGLILIMFPLDTLLYGSFLVLQVRYKERILRWVQLSIEMSPQLS